MKTRMMHCVILVLTKGYESVSEADGVYVNLAGFNVQEAIARLKVKSVIPAGIGNGSEL